MNGGLAGIASYEVARAAEWLDRNDHLEEQDDGGWLQLTVVEDIAIRRWPMVEQRDRKRRVEA